MPYLAHIASTTLPPANGQYDLIKKNYITGDIVESIKNIHPLDVSQTQQFAIAIPGNNIMEYCQNLWRFLKENITYKVDPPGAQFIKSPAQVWKDKECDCKSYSLFIATCLENKGIPYRYRFVSFKPNNPTVTHVYVVVPQKNSYIILDVVLNKFNYEKPFTYKKDMKPQGLHHVHGVGRIMPKPLNLKFDLEGRDISEISDGEMDLLIAREHLKIKQNKAERIRGVGSPISEKYQDKIDVVEDALQVIEDYKKGETDNPEIEMIDITADALDGEYNTSAELMGIGDIGRRRSRRKKKKAARKVKRKARRVKRSSPVKRRKKKKLARKTKRSTKKIQRATRKGRTKKVKRLKSKYTRKKKRLTTPRKTRKAEKKALRKKRKTSRKQIRRKYQGRERRKHMARWRKASGTRTGKFLQRSAKTAKKGVKAVARVATAPARLAAKGILEVSLPKAAPFFLYLFINDKSLLARMPQEARRKRKKAEKVADFIVKGLGMKRKHFMGIVRNGIMKQYGKSPEAVIQDMTTGRLSGIGAVAIVSKVIPVIVKIIKKIGSLFKKRKERLNVSADDAPNERDWGSLINKGANFVQSFNKDVKNQPENVTQSLQLEEDMQGDVVSDSNEFDSGGRSIWDTF